MKAALWGPAHVELGEVAVATAGPRAAVALSRGLRPKAYRYTDPNEDVVAAVAGAEATLLVCADGHNGATAPVTAVEAVLESLGGDPPPRLAPRRWSALFSDVNAAVLDAARAAGQPQSRTVLVVALVADGAVSWGSMGDAALVLCRPGTRRGRQLNREQMRFVGHPMSPRALRDALHQDDTRLEADEWVVLVTDGLSEFVAPMTPADVLPRVLPGGGSRDAAPATAARAVVDAAGRAGAGDNVGVALLAPEG